jgi:integrase
MSRRPLGPRARVRTRIKDGLTVHELLVYPDVSRPPRALRFPTLAEAERQCAIALAELDAGTLDAPSDWPGMIDAFLDGRPGLRASTKATYRFRLEAVARVFEDRDPLTLSATDATAHWVARERAGASSTTIRAELDQVAILQRWCVARGWCRVATWAGVERPEARRRDSHLRPEEIGAFLRAAERLAADPPGERMAEDWRAWPAAAWLLMHGLRAGEVQHLLVRDLDLVHGAVHVRDREGARTKSRQSDRAVPVLSEHALDVLRALVIGRGLDEPAIPMGRAGKAGGDCRSKWLARRCALTCSEAGIRTISPHALRHTVATLAITAGADVSSVQALLGHEDARVTARIYSHAVAGAQAMGAARAVSGFLDRAMAGRARLKAVG